MRKLIDIPESELIPLKVLAAKNNTNLKNYIQNVLSNHLKSEVKK